MGKLMLTDCRSCGHEVHEPDACTGLSDCECGLTDLPCVCDDDGARAEETSQFDA